MFEQAFKNIDDVLWKEAGCTTELDYTEQTSWLLFLKYLDGLEEDKAAEAALEGRKYRYILDAPYRWDSWAAPKDRHGALDHNKALTGDDLRDFQDNEKTTTTMLTTSQKLSTGVDELDQAKLTPLLRLKYHDSIADAIADLGRLEEIGQMFSGFQRYLYQP